MTNQVVAISRSGMKSRRYRKKNPDKVLILNRKYRAEHPERHEMYDRRGSLKRHYGLTIAQYDAMFEAQKGLCAICGQPETKFNTRTGKVWRLAVDHDKHTKKIGGLLCDKCNRGMGYFDHDIELLKATRDYLKERNSK